MLAKRRGTLNDSPHGLPDAGQAECITCKYLRRCIMQRRSASTTTPLHELGDEMPSSEDAQNNVWRARAHCTADIHQMTDTRGHRIKVQAPIYARLGYRTDARSHLTESEDPSLICAVRRNVQPPTEHRQQPPTVARGWATDRHQPPTVSSESEDPPPARPHTRATNCAPWPWARMFRTVAICGMSCERV